jgi:hypothetical protein
LRVRKGGGCGEKTDYQSRTLNAVPHGLLSCIVDVWEAENVTPLLKYDRLGRVLALGNFGNQHSRGTSENGSSTNFISFVLYLFQTKSDR